MRLHVDYSILILQRPFDPEKPAARDDDAIALKGIRGNDDVGDAGLIFEGKKDKSLRGARPLSCDHATGYAHKSIACGTTQIFC